MVAEIAGLAGYTFREVWDHMTWCDYVALSKHWKEWPPIAVSVALQAGIGPQQREKAQAPEMPDQALLTNMFGPMPT